MLKNILKALLFILLVIVIVGFLFLGQDNITVFFQKLLYGVSSTSSVNTGNIVTKVNSNYVISSNGLLIYLDSVGGGISFQKKGEATVNPLNASVLSYDGYEKIYYNKPYIFMVLDNDQLLITNIENGNKKTIDIKICKDARVRSIYYKDNTVYWGQYKEWSACNNSFKKKIKLDF